MTVLAIGGTLGAGLTSWKIVNGNWRPPNPIAVLLSAWAIAGVLWLGWLAG